VSSFGAVSPSWINGIQTGTLIVISPVSALLVLLLTGVMLFGVKNSSLFNVICTALNLIMLCFFVAAGAVLVDPANWTLSVNNTEVYIAALGLCANSTTFPLAMGVTGSGGFVPFGFAGIMKVLREKNEFL
jgi:amino acid transporter